MISCLSWGNREPQRPMPKNVEAIYPLSPMQEGMLFHTLAEPESGVYFQQVCFHLRGNVKQQAFEEAWSRVVQRHAVLRTLFLWERDKEPLQIVREEVGVPWTREDWRGLSPAEQERRFDSFLREDRTKGFQLTEAPLLRLALFRTQEDYSLLVFSFHHILLDGWSSPLIMKEVFSCYEALAREQDIRLDRPKHYRDYIAWLKRQDMPKAEAYWRKTLSGFTAPTALPAGRSALKPGAARSAGYEHAVLKTQLDAGVSASLQSLARNHQLTINTLVQGAWALLLSRYSNTQDVVYGSTVAGRPADLPGVESMVGLFINTLPVRIQVSPEEMLLPWLKRLQEQQVEARQYEYTPLAQIQVWSEIPRGQALFDSILIFENYPLDRSQKSTYAGLEIQDIQVLERTNYPLTLEIMMGAQLGITALYDANRLDGATAERILAHLRTVLEEMAALPQIRLGELPMLTPEEQRQLLTEFNNTAAEYPRDVCAYQLFERQAARKPDAQAVVFENERLSYAELNRQANQLARRLRKMGVSPDTLVGIHMDRSTTMALAVLAVHKAGGAYVPLDPGFPRERLEFMVRDSGLSVLLTQRQLASGDLALRDLGDPGPQTLDVDSCWEEIMREDTADLPPAVASREGIPLTENLAYVIYTSGSTGKPKGVQISHRSLVNFLVAMQGEPGFTEGDTLLAPTTLSFDISALELFLPLITGARVVIVSQETAADGVELLRRLESSGATVMQATPATWRLLLEAGWRKAAGLKVLCGGEALPRDLADRILKTGAQLWNMYGPTETTVWSSVCRVEPGNDAPPIGPPIANMDFHVLDGSLQLVPLGVPGELHIGGDGLGRGYLNRPELNAEKFIPHPFRKEPGQGVYKTGDIVRRLPDGRFDFLGRADTQVKIRGFRIELGEIESLLRRYPHVNEAVVVIREDTPGDQRLIAYLTTEQSPAPEHKSLRAFLQRELPEFMIPSAYVILDAFLLTPTGKINRRALPEPADEHLDHSPTYVAPRTPIQKIIASAWQDILGLEKVGIHDNFFELGGHSLLATRVLARLRQTLKTNLSLRGIVDNPTVASLAGRIQYDDLTETYEYKPKRSTWTSLIPMQPLGTRTPFFLVAGAHADEEQFLRYLSNMIPHLGLNQPVYGFKPRGLDGREKPHRILEEMARDYVEELLEFQPEGPYLLGGECVGGIVAYEMAQVLYERGKDVGLLFLMDTPRPTTIGNIQYRLYLLHRRFLRMLGHIYSIAKLDLRAVAAMLRRKRRRLVPVTQAEHVQKRIENAEDRYIITLSRYRPKPYPGRLTFLVSEGMSFRSIHWMDLAMQGMEVHTVPGNHVTRLTVFGKVTAERLTDCLHRAQDYRSANLETADSAAQSTQILEPQ